MTIVDEIKKMVDVSTDDTEFDLDIVIHINSAMRRLFDLGFKSKIRAITGSEKWEEYSEDELLPSAKAFILLKTKLGFLNNTGPVITSLENQIKELEYLIINGYETEEEGGSNG